MNRIHIKLEYIHSVNYALCHSGIPVCQYVELTNESSQLLTNVQVSCQGEYICEFQSHLIAAIQPGETVRLNQFPVRPNLNKLLELTEKLPSSFDIIVDIDGQHDDKKAFAIDLMSFDQWLGTTILPQSLVAFVTPNHPAINALIVKAAGILKDITGHSAFLAYQSGNINNVKNQIAAVYAALHQSGIIYRSVPASYEVVGQRITTPDQVLALKIGNCIELTLLFASVLESIGINCGIVLQKGHAYLAAWLVDDSCSYSICDDASFLEKKCSRGINEMLVIECTHIAQEKTTFEMAVQVAEHSLADLSQFEMFIDVRRCRLERYLPLPIRVLKNGSWQVEEEGVAHDLCVLDVKEHDRFDLSHLRESKHELTKFDIWERKLLDFSLRNSLLNLHPRRRAVQFISFDINRIEDHLQDGEEYCIEAKPDVDFRFESDDQIVRSKLYEPLRQLIQSDIDHHRLHTFQPEGETQSTLKNIYRSARNSIEETGANSLFLTIGTLRWFETQQSETPRYAPLLMLPVEMVYKKGRYYIRTREEDITFNITLLEFLRQNYNIAINGLAPLPKDDSGVDVPLIFALLRDAMKDQKRWDVEEECLLGNFSFSKFLMWNDIHNNRQLLTQNQIVSSLVSNRLTFTPEPIQSGLKAYDSQTSPDNVALPIAVDSSQLSAIIEGGKGKSFILYGPPGTGKSQTITNLIANALYQGKRVLFVAEKMAALSVVQTRLAKIGLDPFCLELHSNKSTKRHVLEQLDKALKVAHIVPPADYSATAEKIFEHRKKLIEYINALHQKADNETLSLYDCIMLYEAIDGQPLFSFAFHPAIDQFISQQGFDQVENLLGDKLETIVKLVGQPSAHPLNGLRLTQEMMADTAGLTARMQHDMQLLQQFLQRYDSLCGVADLRQTLLRDNDAAIFGLDAAQLHDQWRQANAKWFLPKAFAKKKFIKQLQGYNPYITEAEVPTLLQRLAAYAQQHNQIAQAHHILSQYLGSQFANDEMPPQELVRDTISRLDRWSVNAPLMRDWYHWSQYVQQLQSCGMDCVVAAMESQEWQPRSMRNAYLKALLKYKIEIKISSTPVLSTFEGMLFDEMVRQYKKLTNDFHVLTQKELYARLAARIPRIADNLDNSSEIGLLNRNISNGGRGLSLRDLFDQIPTLLPRLCPCMLMSPMSVAQYIDLSQEKFDLVVFDEASQMPTSEAVGAIARGTSLIVVGDPKQMPPTSFFTSTSVDEEEAAIDDMESILEDCRTLEIPSIQLNWHYRSRHESLIAFSNNEYYDGSLITFPSVDDQETKVQYVHIDGYYDKGGRRNNKAEAEAIVKEVARRLRDKQLAQKSIGIIAFSVVQQTLIEDMLQDMLDKDKVLRDIADAMYEPIFVKNLENVQGDERDVILFSIGYGPTKDGTVSMNFGPLNNAGGERRLNVAVSRARHEMLVFSTLKASQIDLRRSQARGVEGLKHFLDYAETKTLARNSASADSQPNTAIAQQIASRLAARGLNVQTNIGRSQFKVDIALAQPDNPAIYRLGILLDGEQYRDTQTTRDREIVQPSVLSSLNWQVMRVWSVDWFNNPERVIDRILEAYHGAPHPHDEPHTKAAFDISNEALEETTSHTLQYQECVVQQAEAATMSTATLLKSIVAAEQPITFAHLCRRACAIRGIARVTPTIQKELSTLANQLFFVQSDNGQVVWASQADSIDYPWYRPNSGRDINDIPMVEIKNVVREAISEQFALQTDSLTLIAAKKLGFSRRGANVDAAFQQALAQLIAAGEIQETEGKLKANDN